MKNNDKFNSKCLQVQNSDSVQLQVKNSGTGLAAYVVQFFVI